jgi:hypothetical protein
MTQDIDEENKKRKLSTGRCKHHGDKNGTSFEPHDEIMSIN